MFKTLKIYHKIRKISYISHSGKRFSGARFILRYIKRYFIDRLIFIAPTNSFRMVFYRGMGMNIGHDVFIGDNVLFDRLFPEKISIMDHASIGDRCIIIAHADIPTATPLSLIYPHKVADIVIGKGAWIMPGCIVIPGVRIGDNAVIATGAVVTGDIPELCLAGGVPAKVLKKLALPEKN